MIGKSYAWEICRIKFTIYIRIDYEHFIRYWMIPLLDYHKQFLLLLHYEWFDELWKRRIELLEKWHSTHWTNISAKKLQRNKEFPFFNAFIWRDKWIYRQIRTKAFSQHGTWICWSCSLSKAFFFSAKKKFREREVHLKF